MKFILFIVIFGSIAGSLTAGDGNPLPPKRITIAFDLVYPNDYNFKRTDLVLEIRWPEVPDDDAHMFMHMAHEMDRVAYYSEVMLDFGKNKPASQNQL